MEKRGQISFENWDNPFVFYFTVGLSSGFPVKSNICCEFVDESKITVAMETGKGQGTSSSIWLINVSLIALQ